MGDGGREKEEREREIKLRETNWRRGKKVERWKGGKVEREEEGKREGKGRWSSPEQS